MYELEKEHDVSIRGVLNHLPVSRSGYMKWKYRKDNGIKSEQKVLKEELTTEIEAIYADSHEIYGAPKITMELHKRGKMVSQKHVANIMRERGMKAHYVKKYRTRTTINSDFSSKLKNLLNRNFNPTQPNAVWVTDITYVYTHEEGFVYLTTVMDLYSRRIIAWSLSRTMEVNEVLECLKKAKQRREYDDALVL